MSITSIFRGQRPDLTPAQVVGVLVAGVPVIANLLRAFGVYDAGPEQQQALQETMTWGSVVAGLLFASDAGVRAARNAADSRREAAALAAPIAPHATIAEPEVEHVLDEEDGDLPAADEADLAALLSGNAGALPDPPDVTR
jgi:hypothetical protein